MKLQLSAGAVIALAGVGVLALLWLNRRAIGQAASETVQAVGQAINPTSDQNIAYRGTNAIGAAVTGQRDFSLGVWLWERFNTEPDPTAATPPVDQTVLDRWDARARVPTWPYSPVVGGAGGAW